MHDAILVINAGSSSLKFASYIDKGAAEPEFLGKGQIEGIGAAGIFTAKNAKGTLVGEHRWPSDASVTHAEGLEYLIN